MKPHNDRSAAKQRAQLSMLARAQTNAANPSDALGASATQQLNPRYLVPQQQVLGPVSPRDFSNTPLTNLPLYIPGATPNVVGFDLGINKAALDVHLDRGLLCNLPPYPGMAEGDFCALYCNDDITPVDIYPVTQDDVDKQRMIPMYIPRTRLVDGIADPIFIKVTAVGGNSAETPRLKAKVDTSRPGGRNPVASTLQNENLPKPIFPQKIIDFGVSEQDAQIGVPVTFKPYPEDTTQPPTTYRAVRDRIRFSVNGVDANFPPLTEAQAAGQEPITFMLYHGFWQQVKSGYRNAEYQVIDEVGNASDGFSPAQPLIVRLNDGAEPLLPSPLILEAATGVLDHDALNGKDATILINTPNPDFQINDRIRVTVVGRAVDGTTITRHYDHGPILSPSFFALIAFPNIDVRNLVGGRLLMTYARIRDNTPDRQSDGTNADVTGTPIDTRLASPLFIDAVAGVIDPTLLIVNVQVPVPPNRAPSDLVTLFLYGQYANGKDYYRELYKPAGTGIILFKINNGPNGEIAKLEGGSLRARYEVTNIDGTRPSLDVTVQVGTAVASLPEPRVLDALPPAYQYDPDATYGDADIEVKSNGDFKVNDTIILHCEGTAPGGTQPPVPFKILPFWVGLDLPFTLERQYILPNLNQTMRIYYERKRDNELTRLSHAVTMKVGAKLDYPVVRVLEATVTGHNTASLNPRHVLSPPVVTIRVISDKFPATADIKVFITGKTGIGMPDIPAKSARPDPGNKHVDFIVSNAFVPAYLGKHCTIYYNVIEVGKTTKSDDLTLSIESFTQEELNLVSIPQAPGNVIVQNEGNDVEIKKWPFFSRTQHVFSDLESSTDYALRTGKKVSEAEFSAGRTKDPIPASYLQGLSSDDEITIKAFISLDGSSNKSTAIALKPVYYSLERQAEVIGTIPVGRGPDLMAITPDSTKLYVTNLSSNTTTVINTRTHTVEATLDTPGCRGISVSKDGTQVYISRHVYQSTQYVFTYNTVNNAFSGGVLMAGDNWPQGLLANADNTKLYVAVTQNVLEVYNIPSGSLRKRIALGTQPSYIYSDFERKFIYIRDAFESGHYYLRFDQAGDTLLGNTPNLGGSPLGISFHGNRPRAYYTISSKVGILNTSLNTLVGELPGFAGASGIACHPTLNRAYVADSLHNTLTVLDTSTDSLQKLKTLSDFNNPKNVLASPDGKFIYVINFGADAVSVIRV